MRDSKIKAEQEKQRNQDEGGKGRGEIQQVDSSM